MSAPFIGQLRYVKRLNDLHKNASVLSYREVMQQFNGTSWIDIDADEAIWESEEQEAKYKKACEKQYRNEYR